MDTDPKSLYLTQLRERLERDGNSDKVREMLITVALEAADCAWDASERVNYPRGVIDGQVNMAKAQSAMYDALRL